MERFNAALKQVMQVSKADLQRLLEKEKAAHPARKAGRKSKSSTSAPASPDKD
jgi:hypothetical protein